MYMLRVLQFIIILFIYFVYITIFFYHYYEYFSLHFNFQLIKYYGKIAREFVLNRFNFWVNGEFFCIFSMYVY